MRDFYIEKIIAPLAAADGIDGVFFDCFNFAYDMPTPWNRRATNIPGCTSAGGDGCEALLAGTQTNLTLFWIIKWFGSKNERKGLAFCCRQGRWTWRSGRRRL